MSRQPPEKLSVDFPGYRAGLTGAYRLAIYHNYRHDFGSATGKNDFGGGQ